MKPLIIDKDLEELIPGYLKHRNEDIADIKMYLLSNDFELIKKIAHKMKGTGTSYGFDKITEIAKNVELACAKKESGKITGLVSDLDNLIKNIDIVYK